MSTSDSVKNGDLIKASEVSVSDWQPHQLLLSDRLLKLLQSFVAEKNRLELTVSLHKKGLTEYLKSINLTEITFLVDYYLFTRSTPDPSPDLTQQTRMQFQSLIAYRCPAASTEMRILLDEADCEMPTNYCQWFTEMMLKFEDMVIRPLCARLDRLANEPGEEIRTMEQSQRELLQWIIHAKDLFVNTCQEMKKVKETMVEKDAELQDILIEYFKCRAHVSVDEFRMLYPELDEREELIKDEKLFQFAKNAGLLPNSLSKLSECV